MRRKFIISALDQSGQYLYWDNGRRVWTGRTFRATECVSEYQAKRLVVGHGLRDEYPNVTIVEIAVE